MKGLSGEAKIAGVMGWPVGHSRSPRLHGFWLDRYGIDGAYIPLSVDPANLERALRALPLLGFKGVNLTIPHKEEALQFVDKVEPLASHVGAINTVLVQPDGSLEGRNTDVFGFCENLRLAGFVPQKKPVAVLGAGGAARAVIVGLASYGFKEIRIVNRTKDRAEALAASLHLEGVIFRCFSMDDAWRALDEACLLVNATSLGMVGQPALELDLASLPTEAWVTDVVYTPLLTGLLLAAKERGHKVVDGLGMLLHQGRPGFAAWFGRDPEVSDALRQAMLAPS